MIVTATVARPEQAWVGQNILLVTRALEVSAALADAHVDSILLKGCAYALDIYKIGERPFRDIDILIRRADLGAADAVLQAKGYLPKEYRHADQTDPRFNIERHYCGRNVNIDLHFALVQGFRKIEVDYEAMFNVARKLHTTRALGHEDALWFIIEHALRDCFSDDRPYRDFKRYLDRHGAEIDWSAFRGKIEDRQAANAAYFFLERLERLYPGVEVARPRSRPGAAIVGLSRLVAKTAGGLREASETTAAAGAENRSIYASCPGISAALVVGALCEDRVVNKVRRLSYVLFPSISRMQVLYGLAPHARVPRVLYLTRVFNALAVEFKKRVLGGLRPAR